MSDWKPIRTFNKEKPGTRDYLVVAAGVTKVAWYSEDDGWRDSTVPDHLDAKLTRVTHWMEFPEPPVRKMAKR